MNNEEFAMMEGVAISGYDIESAITNTAEATKGAEGVTLLILQDHLKKLCKMQREYLAGCLEEPVVNLTVPQGMTGEARINGNDIEVVVLNIADIRVP